MTQCCNYPIHEDNQLFNEQDNYNYFLETNTRHTLLGCWQEFSLIKDDVYVASSWSDHLPMGYTDIHLYERQAIVEKGEIIWQNLFPILFAQENPEKYFVYNEEIESVGESFSSKEKAIIFAKQISQKTQGKYLIVRHVGSNIWH